MVPYGSQKVKTILILSNGAYYLRFEWTAPSLKSLSLRFTLAANWINEQNVARCGLHVFESFVRNESERIRVFACMYTVCILVGVDFQHYGQTVSVLLNAQTQIH